MLPWELVGRLERSESIVPVLESRSMVSKDISHLTIGSTRHCTRCPFVCMVASSHSHTQTANACNAHVPGVDMIPFVNRGDKKSANRS